jgi:electron transport complex protein RnfC
MFSLTQKLHSSSTSTSGRKRKLWQFHGGVHLPEEKHLSNGEPVRDAPLPAQLVIPLQQHIGAPARACVAVGERVLKGQIIGEPQGYISAPVHASSSGMVSAIEPRAAPHPSGLEVLCVVIDTDGADQWAELPAPITDYQAADAATLRQRVRDCGVVGMGGASFPSNVKLNPGADQPIDTLIINGVECEPYISCDDLLMREQAADIIDGISIMLRVLGAKQCLVGIEDNKPEAILAMQQAVVVAATGKSLGRTQTNQTQPIKQPPARRRSTRPRMPSPSASRWSRSRPSTRAAVKSN